MVSGGLRKVMNLVPIMDYFPFRGKISQAVNTPLSIRNFLCALRFCCKASSVREGRNAHEGISRNIIQSNRNQIVFIIFRLIRNQTEVRLVSNQSENSKNNLISVRLNNISEIFLCVYSRTIISLRPSLQKIK